MKNHNLHLQTNLLGVGFLTYSLITSFLLYGSFGITPIEMVTYRLLGVLLCFSTAIMLKLCYQLWIGGSSYLSFATLVLYVCLFLIEWSTGVGFASNALSHVKEKSSGSSIINEQVKISDIKLSKLSHFSELSTPELEERKLKIANKIIDLETKLAGCPARDYTHCQNPKILKIELLNKSLTIINVDLKNAKQYNFALNQKEAALNSVAYSKESELNYHPLFKVQSKIFNLEVKETEAKYLGFSSLIATILTSILFLIASILKNRFEDKNQPSPIENDLNFRDKLNQFTNSVSSRFSHRTPENEKGQRITQSTSYSDSSIGFTADISQADTPNRARIDTPNRARTVATVAEPTVPEHREGRNLDRDISYTELKAAVIDGSFIRKQPRGIGVNSIKRFCSVGTRKAQERLKLLFDEGVIDNNNRLIKNVG